MDLHSLSDDLTTGTGPLYRRLADGLRTAVRAGEIGVGTRLPSERDLAVTLRISRTTVINAYRVLREDGLLTAERGSGTRVAGTAIVGPAVPAAALVSMKVDGEPEPGIIDLSSSVVIEPIPSLAGEQVVPLDLCGSHYEPLGISVLREQLAARYTARGLPTAAGDILVTTGAQQAISLVFALYGRDGGPIVVETPTYAGALDAARAAGVSVVSLPRGSSGVDVAALRETLRRRRPALVYLMTTVHNPTGSVLDPIRRAAVLEAAAQYDVPVVDDGALSDLLFAEHPRQGAVADLSIGSLDKTCWPGLRVGWIRAPAPIMVKLARLKATADLGSSTPSQLIASRLVPVLDEIAAERRVQLRERLDVLQRSLREHLPSWEWTTPSGGMFLWVRLPQSDAETYAEMASRHGVRVLPGPRTNRDGDFADHLRISFTAVPDVLRAGVERLHAAWQRTEPTRPADRVALDVVV